MKDKTYKQSDPNSEHEYVYITFSISFQSHINLPNLLPAPSPNIIQLLNKLFRNVFAIFLRTPFHICME